MKMLSLFLLISSLGACTLKDAGGKADELTMLVGTYTDGTSKGIYTFRFDQQTGSSSALDSVELPNPSYLTVSDNRKFVYAVSEMNDNTAALNTLAFNPESGSLRLVGKQLTHGADPCYVVANDRMVLTANYSGGSLSVFPLNADGTTAPADTLFHGQATGPDKIRQITPHIHCTAFSPDGDYVFATDFSADRILRFAVTSKGLSATPEDTAIPVKPDSGPRHLTFAPDGKHAYAIGELSGEITAFAYADGNLTTLQTIAADTTGARGSADIHVSPDGKFLYASNRLKAERRRDSHLRHTPAGRHARAHRLSTDRHTPAQLQHHAEWQIPACGLQGQQCDSSLRARLAKRQAERHASRHPHGQACLHRVR